MNMDHHRYFIAATVIFLHLSMCRSTTMMMNYPQSSDSGIMASISNEVYATSVVKSNAIAPTATVLSAYSASMMNPLPSISPTPNSRPPSSMI